MELSRSVNVFGRQSGVLGIPGMANRDRNVRLSFLFPGSQSKHLSMLWGLGGPVKSAMEVGAVDSRPRCCSYYLRVCHSERSEGGVRNLESSFATRSAVAGPVLMTTAEHPRFLAALGMTGGYANYSKVTYCSCVREARRVTTSRRCFTIGALRN